MNRLQGAWRSARLAVRGRSASPSPKRARAVAPATPQSPYVYNGHVRRGLAEFRALLNDDGPLIRYSHSQGDAKCWQSRIKNSSETVGGHFASRDEAV